VTERGVRAVKLEDVQSFADGERPIWRQIRSELGVEAFGINAWEAVAAGQNLIGEHDEVSGGAGGHQELYLVLRGKATFTVDGESIDAPAMTFVFVADPESKRGAVAEDEGTIVLVVGAKAGVPFEISPWERNSAALRYWTTEEWDKAIALLSEQVEAQPESGGPMYNLACAEARDGRKDAALEHLSRAVELEPRFRELAQGDSDFESIRDDPRFPLAEAL
jgi:tetratricopeptide (TPR) repeat protein